MWTRWQVLVFAYYEGRSVKKDPKQFFQWTKKAAEAGSTWAMCNLGIAYRDGKGTRMDWDEFMEWTKRAADTGHVESMGLP